MIRSNRWTRSQPSPIAQLVERELAGVKEAGTSTYGEGGSSSSRYSSIVYSRRCQGLSDFSAPSGASVNRLGVEMNASGAAAPIAASSAVTSSMCSIVCRKTTASQRSGDVLDQVALEAQVGPPVARRGVLVGLGIGVDPDDVGSGRGQHVRAVSLTASQIGHPQAFDLPPRSTRRRRGGAGTSSSPPERREGCARPSAPAAGRRRADRPAGSAFPTRGWRKLTAGGRYSPAAMPAAADATAERIRDVNTRYHDLAADSYDAKWGIDFGATGQAQVRSKLTQGARVRARPLGACARDRRRNRLLLAQPDDRRADHPR